MLCDFSRGEVVRAGLLREDAGSVAYGKFHAESLGAFMAGATEFLNSHGYVAPAAVAISAPGWERGGIQHMPNHGFHLDRDYLRKAFGVRRLHIVNTGLARAMSVPKLGPDGYRILFGGEVDPDKVRCIVGAGMGLGMASIVPDESGRWCTFPGAGGHSDLAATSDEQFVVLKALADKFGHVSRERVLSLGGLGEIWMAIAADISGPAQSPGAVEIVRAAATGDDLAVRAVRMCTEWLAATAGDVALIMGARGGVYLIGELIDLLKTELLSSRFRECFTNKGRLSEYMRDVPVCLIEAEKCELIGLSALFDA